MTENPYRLARTVVPRRYDLTLTPDLARATFSGRETIQVEVEMPVTEILLNAHQLEIQRAVISNGATTVSGTVELIPEDQRARIALDGPIGAGSWRLDLEFTGILNDQLVGFYRSTFTDVDGVEQAIATTQFEATDARRAFPCWDEPDLKAVFSITLVVPEDLLAVSNTPELERRDAGDGRVAIRFADTMVMSTYLVAFVVGPFEATDPVDVEGVPVRIIAPRGKLGLSSFALECAVFDLRYLRDYYGIPYPGLKIDHVAIPDFAFGAMENLGCITYRETALLVDPGTASQSELLRVLDVIGHELAHMWFGDLVTMKWWDGIWLNEAFASFMEFKATNAMRPEWKRWLSFAAVERPWALGVDALQSTRPVEFEVRSPDEANEMFDALTYGKGSSVLRMIEQFIGEESFRQGVGNYLRRHSYANTVTADLWNGLNAASGQPVGEIMDTWILQRGFPQLEVTPTASGIKLSQRRFLTIPDDSDQTLWQVPVQIRSTEPGEPQQKYLLKTSEATIPIPRPGVVIANAGGHGFYRVRYDRELFSNLVDRLASLDDLERYGLIDDTWAFVESGQQPATDFLRLAGAYQDETEQAVWGSVLGGVAAIGHHLVDDDHRPAFANWVGALVTPAFSRLGWDPRPGESDLTRRLRGQLIGALGRLADDPDVIARCRKLVEVIIEDPRVVDPEIARASLFVTADHGGETEYRRFYDQYKTTTAPHEQQRWLLTLAAFDNPDLVVETVTASLDGRIRTQDSAWVIGASYGNRVHGHLAWQQVRRNWDSFVKLPTMTQRRMIEGLPALARPEVAAEIQAFFAETSLPHCAKSIAQNLERLRANVLLRKRETAAVGEFLSR
ncbi:MAG TPA: M1 family metallopeptidase [Acidimicrobiia bacterium]|nr:M1 family metallopeptidase [Acidimicrobiia bacterium]